MIRGQSTLPEELSGYQAFLQKWAGMRYDELEKHMKKLREKLNKLLANMEDEKVMEQVNKLAGEIDKLAEVEEAHWKQRSRANWLAEGDRNTMLFHAMATQRKKTNTVGRLLNPAGEWVREEEEEKIEIINDYFMKIFDSSQPTHEEIKEVLKWGVPQLKENDVTTLMES